MILPSAEINKHNKRGAIFMLCEEPFKRFIILVTETLPYIYKVILCSLSGHLHISCFPCFLVACGVGRIDIILISI